MSFHEATGARPRTVEASAPLLLGVRLLLAADLLRLCSRRFNTYEASVGMLETHGFPFPDTWIVVALFTCDDEFPHDVTKAAYTESGALESKATTVEISGVEPGTYAILALHDENGDSEVETNWIGIPSEGLAMSN